MVMETQGQRRAPRIKLGEIPVKLSANGRISVGKVLDVSRNGAFLSGCAIEEGAGVVEIQGPQPVTRECKVRRTEKGWSAVEFARPLSHREMCQLVDGYESAMIGGLSATAALAWRDMGEVREEIRAIQGCRSNVFLATLGTIAAAIVTIGGLAIKGEIHAGGILFGVCIAFGLFVVGILSTIEKARAVNIRKGFLKTLSKRLSRGAVPEFYTGWASLSTVSTDCGVWRRVGACALGHEPGYTRTCKDLGVIDAERLNKETRLVPDVFSSFMTLSSVVYSCLYLLILVAVCYYLAEALKEPYSIDAYIVAGCFAVGALGTPYLIKWKQAVCGMLIAFGISVVFGEIFPIQLTGVLIAFFTGTLLGSLGWYLAQQANAVRKGKHSLNTSSFMWERIIDNPLCAANRPTEVGIAADHPNDAG
jgi:hypothetical protein